jgi:hypothetical protein
MIDINLKHPKISQKTNICHFELSGKLAIVRNRPLLLHNVYLENAMHPHLSIIFQITKNEQQYNQRLKVQVVANTSSVTTSVREPLQVTD